MSSRNAAIIAAAERVAVFTPLVRGDFSTQFLTKIDKHLALQILDLTRTNMEALYNACPEPEWKWNSEEKLKSFIHSKSRFIVVRDSVDNLVGFVCFRFLVDDKRPVVYVYELQVAQSYAKRGVGRFLMLEIDRLVKTAVPGISHTMLTCFVHNPGAIDFYKKLGFITDVTSPSGNRSYVILSKRCG